MKTNIVDALERNARAGEKWIEPKSQLPMLLLVSVALAVGGCESNPGEPVARSSFLSPADTSESAYAGGPGFAVGLSGLWFHNDQRTSISVQPDGRNLTIINEQGRRSDGYATSPREIEIPSLRIKGYVSHGGRRISWTNGTEWTREPQKDRSDFGQGPGQGLGQGLSGRWFHDGKPTSISVSAGGSVTITNEQGQRSSGKMTSNNELNIAGIRGHVSNAGRRISWSNGTEWTR
jgi:hypothetical protein